MQDLVTMFSDLKRLNKMMERILKGWTLQRALYLLLGSMVIIQAIVDEQWIAVAFGGYFAAIGLFAFGCAAGNCYTGNQILKTKQTTPIEIKDVEFEEIKIKS